MRGIKKFVAAMAVMGAASLGGAPAFAASEEEIALNAVQGAVQSVIQQVRDQIRRQQQTRAAPGTMRSYNPTWTVGASVDGGWDWNRAKSVGGKTTGRSTNEFIGIDATRTGVFRGTDAITIGAFGTFTQSETAGASSNTDTGGVFVAYIDGNFSTDVTGTWGVTRANAGDSTTDSISNNYSYRFDLPYKYFIEPTAGYTYSVTHANLGGDTNMWKVQAGARVGTEFRVGSVIVQPTTTLMVASDVYVETPLGTQDQRNPMWSGKHRWTFVWTEKFSTFVEGGWWSQPESGALHTSGSGESVKIGGRVTF